MWCGIASPFCCSPILGPIAIINGSKVISLLEQYPGFERRSNATAKARADQIIGWISIALFVIGMIVRFGNLR